MKTLILGTKKTPCDFCGEVLIGNLNEKSTILCSACLGALTKNKLSSIDVFRVMDGEFWDGERRRKNTGEQNE